MLCRSVLNRGNNNYYNVIYFVIGIKPSDKKADAFGAPMPCGAGSSMLASHEVQTEDFGCQRHVLRQENHDTFMHYL